MVVTEGDHFAQLVEEEKLGIVVPSGDVAALTAALETVLYDEKFIRAAKRNVERVRRRYFWGAALEPLVRFAGDPRHAADLVARGVVGTGQPARRQGTRRKKHGIRHDVGLFFHYMRTGGPAVRRQEGAEPAGAPVIDAPAVSVALCTFNGARFVRRQVASILAQTRPADQLVVSDDASTDSTIAILEEEVRARP